MTRQTSDLIRNDIKPAAQLSIVTVLVPVGRMVKQNRQSKHLKPDVVGIVQEPGTMGCLAARWKEWTGIMEGAGAPPIHHASPCRPPNKDLSLLRSTIPVEKKMEGRLGRGALVLRTLPPPGPPWVRGNTHPDVSRGAMNMVSGRRGRQQPSSHPKVEGETGSRHPNRG